MEVTIGVYADPGFLCAWRGTGVPDANITRLVSWSLLIWDDNLEFIPLLAESWDFPDDTTIVFNLNEGMYFHDGVEMTAEDVVFTYEEMVNPDARDGAGYGNRIFYANVDEVVATDRYTVEFRLSQPDAPLMYFLGVPIMPKHIAEEHGVEYLQRNLVGVGPFKFVEWEPQEHIILEADDNFFMGRPQIDKITFRQIPEMATRVLEMETGGIHLMDTLAPEEVPRLQDDPEVNVEIKPGTGYTYFLANWRMPPFDDVNVRKALGHITDQQLMIDTVYYGMADEINGPIIPHSWAYCEESVVVYDYDLDKAAEYLAEAGIDTENRLSATITFATHDQWRQIAEMIQFEGAKVGLDFEIQELDRAIWGTQSRVPDAWELTVWGWSGQTDPDRGVWRQFHPRGGGSNDGGNLQGYVNEELVPILEASRGTFDMDERFALYQEIQRIVTEDANHVYIAADSIKTAHRVEVKNFSYSGYFYFHDLWDAWLEY